MKPIKLDKQIKETLIENFTKYLDNAKLSDDMLSYSTKITQTSVNASKAKIVINALAYLKMMLYVRDTSTEIAWHGTVIKEDDNTYHVTDVFLYPQKLAAATVTTDQEKYNKWCEEIDDNTYNCMRLQGHSHVNFGTNPSGTDTNFYDNILQVLPKNDFYIFMIMNKAGDMFFLIYDLANNLIYEKQDIDIILNSPEHPDFNLFNLIDLEKTKYCEKPAPVTSPYACRGGYTNPYHDYWRQTQYASTIVHDEDDFYTETDALYADLDNKFKNAKLQAPKTKKGKKK